MQSIFNFNIVHPAGHLASYIQGIWSASTPTRGQGNVTRWLQGDGCSGILFNFGEGIYINETEYTSRVVLLPVGRRAFSVTLPPGTELAGIRFHPAVGFGVFGKNYAEPTAYRQGLCNLDVQSVYHDLLTAKGHQARIAALYDWVIRTIKFSNIVPVALSRAIQILDRAQHIGDIVKEIPISQRQLERQLKNRAGIGMKELQRILRVKNALRTIKQNPEIDLVDLALKSGYSDQSHMTREIKQIAYITPRLYGKLIINRQLQPESLTHGTREQSPYWNCPSRL